MSLRITQSIVHHIYKDPDGNLGLRVSNDTLDEDEQVSYLLEELNGIYNAKPAKGYATFINSNDYEDQENPPELPQFPKHLDSWLKGDEEFVSFSQQAGKVLNEELTKYAFADHGFLLMADFEQSGDRFLLVSFLPVKDGLMVQPDLSVNKSSLLDVSKLQLAARINLTDYAAPESDSHYISFIKGRAGRKVSDFFLDFLGCIERVNAKKQTEELVNTVQAFSRELAESDDTTPEISQAMRKEVYDYCGERWQQGEPVEIDALDARLQESGTPSLKAFTEAKGQQLPDTFPADRTTLRKLMKFSGQGGGLSIGFDQQMLGKRVEYDADTDTLTIKGTPPNLRDQLRRYFGFND